MAKPPSVPPLKLPPLARITPWADRQRPSGAAGGTNGGEKSRHSSGGGEEGRSRKRLKKRTDRKRSRSRERLLDSDEDDEVREITGANAIPKSVPRRTEEDEELKQPPKKKASNVASRLSDNDAITEQNLHKDFLNFKLTGNPHTSEKGGSEEAVQRVSGSGPLQRDEEARGDPLPQLVGQGRNRDGPQHRDMELQPGKDLLIETSTN